MTESAPATELARSCAEHPGTAAPWTCTRCGAFACEACWPARDELCATCLRSSHGSFDVPWEREPRGGFFATLRAQWLEQRFFAHLPAGKVDRALWYAVHAYFPVLALFSLMIGTLPARDEGNGASTSFLCTAIGGSLTIAPVVVVVVGTWVHLVARLLGGRTAHGEVLRMVAYSQGYVLLLLPWTLAIPFAADLGRTIVFGFLFVCSLGIGGLQVRAAAAYLAARGGLDRSRALFAAASPAMVVAVLLAIRLV